MKQILSGLLFGLLVGYAVLLSQGEARGATSVTQFGVTFTFSADRPVGQFADGSWYVLAPVTITEMSPAFSAGNNGWEVNPLVQNEQGLQGNGPNYSAALMPSLPYTATSARSIVKVIASGVTRSTVQTAVVLTVLNSEPSGGGSAYFRPPYVGTAKPLFPVSALRTDRLPSLPPVGAPPTLAAVVANFSKCLRMDHSRHYPRYFRPKDAFSDDYMPSNAPRLNEAMLRLMLNDPIEDKMPALIQFTQHAIDRAYIVMGGYNNATDSGHNPNHRIVAAWAGLMLDDVAAVFDYLEDNDGFQEERFVLWSDVAEKALWGEPNIEQRYWLYAVMNDGSRSNYDPYRYIDGGRLSSGGASYQNITVQSHKGSALIATLIPTLQRGFYSGHWPTLNTYAERWVTHGVWASPDPVATADPQFWTNDGIANESMDNYGVTFGPNGSGSYIAGDGRFSQFHGAGADSGQYRSSFVAAMWDAYYDAPVDEVEGVLQLSASSYSVSESGGTLTITATRTGGSDGAVGLSYATSDGTATAGDDYTAASGTLSWADGDATSKTFAVTITNDATTEGNETFTVTLSSPSGGATLGGISVATVTIVDDDVAPAVPAIAIAGWDAEDMLVESPAYVTEGIVTQDNTVSDPALGGRLRGIITIETAGDYTMTGTLNAPVTTSDTFFIEIGEEPTTPTDIVDLYPIVGDGVTAFTLPTRGTGSWDAPQNNPMVWTLATGEHTVFIRMRESGLQLTSFSMTLLGADTTAPTPDPMTFALVPTQAGDSDVIMIATAASDPSGPVEYYFDETTGGGTDSSWQTSTSYNDSDLVAGTYTYRVKARDAEGNETAYSESASITVAAPLPPVATGLAQYRNVGGTITWTDESDDETGFKIERSTDNTNWTLIATTAANATTYTDRTALAGTLYYYRVRATNGAGDSTNAVPSTASITTAPAAPVYRGRNAGGGGLW